MRTTRGLYRNGHRARRAIFHHRLGLGTRPFHFVDAFDEKKNAKCNDQEIDRDRNEIPVREHRTKFFRLNQRQTRFHFVRQRNVEIAEVEIVVQVNGKVRDRMMVSTQAPEEEIKKAALALPKIEELTAGKQIRKVVVIPKKLVNIVVA